MLICLAQASVTPDKNIFSQCNDHICWYSYICIIFHMPGCYRSCCSASFSSHSSAEKRLDGWRANKQRSSRLFELSTQSPTKPDNILWLLKHYSPERGYRHQVCSVTVSTDRRGRNAFFVKLPSPQVYSEWETAASAYVWKPTDAPVDWGGKFFVFHDEQSRCDEVWHAASFGG